MIRFIHVYQGYYPGFYVFNDIDLEIKPQEFIFLVGPSGVGKTTFLKLIYREELPSKGEILVAGFNVKVLPKRKLPLLRRKLGIVFQDFKLLSQLSVRENMALGLQILGYPSSFIKRRVAELSEYLELEDKLEVPVSRISTGEKQRVAIARALAPQPPILLADEPTSNLDHKRAVKVIKLFKESNNQGNTVIIATHNQELTNFVPSASIFKIKEQKVIKVR